jgi:hypothetical protein
VVAKPVTQVAGGVVTAAVTAVVTVVVKVVVIKRELGNRAIFRPAMSNYL